MVRGREQLSTLAENWSFCGRRLAKAPVVLFACSLFTSPSIQGHAFRLTSALECCWRVLVVTASPPSSGFSGGNLDLVYSAWMIEPYHENKCRMLLSSQNARKLVL